MIRGSMQKKQIRSQVFSVKWKQIKLVVTSSAPGFDINF